MPAPPLHDDDWIALQRTFDEQIGSLIAAKPFSHIGNEKGSKTVAVFLGAPGCGKTQLLKKLARKHEAAVFHPRDVARSIGIPESLIEAAAQRAELLPDLSAAMETALLKCHCPLCFLDGYPRSQGQADDLLARAKSEGWTLIAFHLTFPRGKEVSASRSRQSDRAVHAGALGKAKEEQEERAFRKIARYLLQDLAAVRALCASGILMREINVFSKPRLQYENVAAVLNALAHRA